MKRQKLYINTILIGAWIVISFNRGFAQQKIVVVRESDSLHNISPYAEFFEDKSAKLTLQDILDPASQQQFIPLRKDLFNHPATQSAFWIRFKLKNQSKENLWMKVGNAFSAWYIDFYTISSQQKSTIIQTGALRGKPKDTYAAGQYFVNLGGPSEQFREYYLRVEGGFPQVYILQVGNKNQISGDINKADDLFKIFLGAILSILLYNIFLLVSVKEKVYLMYVLYLGVVLLVIPFDSGNPYFTDNPFFWKYWFVWHSTVFLLSSLFTIYYLELPQKHKRWYKYILLLSGVMCLLFPLLNVFQVFSFAVLINIYQPIIMIYYVSLLSCGFWVWRKGVTIARFYVLAWLPILASVTIFILTINGIVPANILTLNSIYIGFVFECMLFGIALGDKYRAIRQEKELQEKRYFQLVEEQNKELETKVLERTRQLQEQQEEINAQNEELRQSQEELETQRDFLDDQNNRLEIQNKRIQSSIKAAKAIQQAVLPYEERLEDILPGHFIINRPKDVVSGDFYWVQSIENKTILVVADCTGHGVPGAFMTLIGSNLLDKIVLIEKVLEPSAILESLHQELKKVLKQQETGNDNGMDLVVVSLQHKSDHTCVQFSAARNSLFYFDAITGQIEELKGARRGIGGRQNEKIRFQTQEFRLPTGSKIYVGSDGLEDQGDLHQKRFGRQRLKNLLSHMIYLPLPQQKHILEKELDTFMQGAEQRDDILFVGVEV